MTNTADTAAELRVLVVEDDPGIARSLVRGLTRAGFRVDTVGIGAGALTAGPAGVVLLDLGLRLRAAGPGRAGEMWMRGPPCSSSEARRRR